MPGAQAAPAASRAKGKSTQAKSPQVRRSKPALPAQWLYGLFRALPGEPGFVATITCEIIARRLDISVGISGPRGFAVRYPAQSSDAPKASIAFRTQHS